MTDRILVPGIVAAWTFAAAIAVYRWERPLASPATVMTQVGRVTAVRTDAAFDTVDLLPDGIIARDPFRIARVPASVPFGYSPPASSEQASRPHPAITLRGIVGGPPWQAILDGLPGQAAGTVVGQGFSTDSLLVKRITRDSVVIVGPDTTWILLIGRAQ